MFLPHLFSGILCFSFVYEFLLPNLLSSFINRPKIHLSWVNQIYSWRIFRIENEYRRRFKGDCEQTKPYVNSSFAHVLTQFLSFLIYCYHHSFIKGQNCHSKLIDAVHCVWNISRNGPLQIKKWIFAEIRIDHRRYIEIFANLIFALTRCILSGWFCICFVN